MHRVTFYTGKIHFNDVATSSKLEILERIGEEFKKTKIAEWVENNNIHLMYMQDDGLQAWFKQLSFFGDLTEEQYVDYALRFSNELIESKQ